MVCSSIVREEVKCPEFAWGELRGIKDGISSADAQMPVIMNHLMQHMLFEVLCKIHGLDRAYRYFRQAGFMAGYELVSEILKPDKCFSAFVHELQETLVALGVGVLCVESFNLDTYDSVITVSRSHLRTSPRRAIASGNISTYDEGFLAGVFEAYIGVKYDVREVVYIAGGKNLSRYRGKAAYAPAS